MRTIETVITVTADGEIIVPARADLPPGAHRAVLVIEEPLQDQSVPDLDTFPVRDLGPWPNNLSLRREELYDDWGR